MNTLQRRKLVKARVIDVTVAKAAINQSRRERHEAAAQLNKALAAKRYAAKSASAAAYSLPAAS